MYLTPKSMYTQKLMILPKMIYFNTSTLKRVLKKLPVFKYDSSRG